MTRQLGDRYNALKQAVFVRHGAAHGTGFRWQCRT